MKTLIIWTIVSICAIIYIAQPELKFKPFSFKINAPYTAAGYILLGISLSLINYQTLKDTAVKYSLKYYKKGYTEGYGEGVTDMSQATTDVLNKMAEEHKNKK